MRRPVSRIGCQEQEFEISGANQIQVYWEQKFQPLGQLLPENRILNLLDTVHLACLRGWLNAATTALFAEGRVLFTRTQLLECVARISLEYKLRWKSLGYQI